MEIPQRAGEQRDHPVLVQPGPVRGGQPAEQGLAQPGELGESDLAQRGLDERALAGPAGRQALGLQLLVGLQHRVRVDRQRGDHVPDLRQLVAQREVAQPQRVLDLVHQLQVGRHPGGRIQPELDRRPRPARPAPRRAAATARKLWHCRGPCFRQVGEQPPQVAPGLGAHGPPDPVVELGLVEAASGEVLGQPAGDRLALGVGDAQVLVGIHAAARGRSTSPAAPAPSPLSMTIRHAYSR